MTVRDLQVVSAESRSCAAVGAQGQQFANVHLGPRKLWVRTMVPETKGVPLEQMQKRLGISPDLAA